MDERPWYQIVDKVTAQEQIAIDMLTTGGSDWAFEIMDERIRRVSKLIQESWTDKQRNDRFTGDAEMPARVPYTAIHVDGRWEQYWIKANDEQ
jgi:hypothetical protein